MTRVCKVRASQHALERRTFLHLIGLLLRLNIHTGMAVRCFCDRVFAFQETLSYFISCSTFKSSVAGEPLLDAVEFL